MTLRLQLKLAINHFSIVPMFSFCYKIQISSFTTLQHSIFSYYCSKFFASKLLTYFKQVIQTGKNVGLRIKFYMMKFLSKKAISKFFLLVHTKKLHTTAFNPKSHNLIEHKSSKCYTCKKFNTGHQFNSQIMYRFLVRIGDMKHFLKINEITSLFQ